jgi:hypothetical protein
MPDPHASTVPIHLRSMGGVARYSGSAQSVASRLLIQCWSAVRLARRPGCTCPAGRITAPHRLVCAWPVSDSAEPRAAVLSHARGTTKRSPADTG